MHAGGDIGSDFSGPALTVTMFFAVVLSSWNSLGTYYTHVLPIRQLSLAREYKGVYAEAPGISYPDAAYVEFAGNATIDVSKATSYRSLNSRLATFCVAPIGSPASTGRYGFWAIGIDCCGQNGEKFECHDAGKAGVKTGWVLPERTVGDTLIEAYPMLAQADQRRDNFLKAIRKAEAAHGISTPGDDAVLLRWKKDTKSDILWWETFAVTFALFGSVLWIGGLSFLMTRLHQRFSYVRKIHRIQHHFGIHGDEENSEEKDVTSRLQHFLAQSEEGLQSSPRNDMSATIAKVGDMLNVEIDEPHRPPLSAADMCLMGVLVPYLLFMASVIVSTYAPCAYYGYMLQAVFWCLTGIFIVALLATPNRMLNGMVIMIACTMGFYLGNRNYKDNMFHYCSTEDRRSYIAVHANESTDNFWDAGKLKFADSEMLSTDHSVGFLFQGTSYCAAPVMSKTVGCNDPVTAPANAQIPNPDAGASDASLLQMKHHHLPKHSKRMPKHLKPTTESSSGHLRRLVVSQSFLQERSSRASHRAQRAMAQTGRTHHSHEHMADPVDAGNISIGCRSPAVSKIEFWAVGKGCCDARNKFWCDGGDVEGAREAVVVRELAEEDSEKTIDHEDRFYYQQAILQAVAAYDLPTPGRPVLLRWGSSARELQMDWHNRAISVILMVGLMSCLFMLVFGISSFCFMKRMRRLEQLRTDDYEARAGGKSSDPTVYESPRNSLQPKRDEARKTNEGNQGPPSFLGYASPKADEGYKTPGSDGRKEAELRF